jgi:hypothetical protein
MIGPREAHTRAMVDQIRCLLEDRGPMTTREVEDALGRNAQDVIAKTRWWCAYNLLGGMHRRGEVERMKATRSVMWWLK